MENDKKAYSVQGSALRRTGATVREFESAKRKQFDRGRGAANAVRVEEGILLEDLAGTDDPNVPGTATFQIKTSKKVGYGWANVAAPSIVTVMNRSAVDYASGTFGLASELQQDRWHFSAAGGGGGHEIWFTIDSVYCEDSYDLWHLVATPTYYSAGCTAPIPGADEYTGQVDIYDICNIHGFYTDEWLVGQIGRATYMYPRTGECLPLWLLDTICGTPECT